MADTREGAFALDLDRTLITVMVPTAPRTTISPGTPPDPTHLPMTVTLRQLKEALDGRDA